MGFKAIRNQGVMNDEHAFTITVEIQTKTVRQVTWQKLQHWLIRTRRTHRSRR